MLSERQHVCCDQDDGRRDVRAAGANGVGMAEK
jgi:hypothetical protein